MRSVTQGAIIGNALVLAKFYAFESDLEVQGAALGMAAAMWFPVLWTSVFGDGAPFAPKPESDGTPISGQQDSRDIPRD